MHGVDPASRIGQIIPQNLHLILALFNATIQKGTPVEPVYGSKRFTKHIVQSHHEREHAKKLKGEGSMFAKCSCSRVGF